MPLWRCPHCATPQPEAARCWVCRRSTTSCASCRHFRRGVTSGLGFCGLDRKRLVLRGDELRACWTSRPDLAPSGDVAGTSPTGTGTDGRRAAGERKARTFVPIEELEPRADTPAAPTMPAAASRSATGPQSSAAEGARWSLWGDAEG